MRSQSASEPDNLIPPYPVSTPRHCSVDNTLTTHQHVKLTKVCSSRRHRRTPDGECRTRPHMSHLPRRQPNFRSKFTAHASQIADCNHPLYVINHIACHSDARAGRQFYAQLRSALHIAVRGHRGHRRVCSLLKKYGACACRGRATSRACPPRCAPPPCTSAGGTRRLPRCLLRGHWCGESAG